jgi:hypothetical protein
VPSSGQTAFFGNGTPGYLKAYRRADGQSTFAGQEAEGIGLQILSAQRILKKHSVTFYSRYRIQYLRNLLGQDLLNILSGVRIAFFNFGHKSMEPDRLERGFNIHTAILPMINSEFFEAFFHPSGEMRTPLFWTGFCREHRLPAREHYKIGH